ncbi:MAG: DUF177 domain-containing protein [Chloroflexi bacterium]|nr:DUF177 domain-containing protein [Chloroflexota bacterium]MCL5273579.1 DUF177 domain-containing protein [Chloroflexota bacterium]
MRFRLNRLLGAPIGARQYEQLDRGRTWFDDELQVAYLRGELTFTRTDESILVEGDIETATTVQCVRSLDLFEMPLSFSLDDVAFTLPGYSAPEPDRKIRDDGYIDLTDTIRELIIMAIPINPIHPRYLKSEMLNELTDEDVSDWLTIKWADNDEGRGDLL